MLRDQINAQLATVDVGWNADLKINEPSVAIISERFDLDFVIEVNPKIP